MYDVNEQAWFTSQRTHGQLSGLEQEEVASHLLGTMSEVIEQSIESRDVNVSRYDGSELKQKGTRIVAQSTDTPKKLRFLSVRGDIRLGDELLFDGFRYLVVTPETQTPLYDRTYGLWQTHSLFITITERIDTGRKDPMGRPVYENVTTQKEIRIAFEPRAKEGVDTSEGDLVNTPQEKVYFYVQLNPDTKKWKQLDPLTLLGKQFKIVNIDYTNTIDNGAYGVLYVEANRSV